MDRVSQRVGVVNAIIHVAWTNVASSRAFISTEPRLIAIEGEDSSIPFYFIHAWPSPFPIYRFVYSRREKKKNLRMMI